MNEPAERPTADPLMALGPVQPRERILEIDVLRGFAIFGILLVNMAYFAHPVYREVLGLLEWAALHDRIAEAFVMFAGQGKFFTLFSLLFGFGLAIQLRRAEERGRPIVPVFLRRMLVLALFGAAHIVLLWFGDILLYYAVLGVVLLAFRNCRPRTLIRWTVALLVVPLIFISGLYGLVELGRLAPEGAEQMAAAFAEAEAEYAAQYEDALEVYSAGTFGEMVQRRLADYAFGTVGLLFTGMGFIILAMFLLGLYVGRRGIMHDVVAHLGLIRRVAVVGAVVGVIANVLSVASAPAAASVEPGPAMLLALVAFVVGAPALCLAYAAGIVLLLQRDAWRRRLDFLAPVGRMALTNYLLQSIVCTTIFYGYGLGLYGRTGPAVGILLAVAIFALQVPFSRWWLGRYRFGPLEWLWRTLTYGEAQPLRREVVATS